MLKSTLCETKWTQATRDEYFKTHPERFADRKNKAYPIRDASDVEDAWDLAGHADNPDEVRANIKRIAKDMGLSHALPDTAKDDGEKQEGAATIASSVATRPRKKIATLRVCWLEYNARSLNGRIYPKATCDRIYETAVRKLGANDLPITVFVSHEAANGNVNTELVGRASRIWQEGAKFWADLDLADTRTAWDMLALAEGGYLRSESMRVLGVELQHDRNYDLPLVVIPEGVEPELLGIDLTTRPGLMDTARIQQVLYEAAQQTPYTESFTLDSVVIQSKEEASMGIPLYLQVIAGMPLSEAQTADRKAHQRIHDHLAGVLDDTVKAIHGNESASLIGVASLSEEGRAIAQKHAVKLAAAHDEAATACGMECAGGYKESLGIPLDPDQDGDTDAELVIADDDDGNESVRRNKKGKKVMTEAEMLAALQAKGFSVTPPKSALEEMAELKTRLEEQQRQIEALKAAPATQRQTQAAPSQMQETDTAYQPEAMYMHGDHLATAIHPRHWKALAGNGVHQNRAVPWPKNADPMGVVAEMAPIMAYDLLMQEATTMRRDINTLIGANEQI